MEVESFTLVVHGTRTLLARVASNLVGEELSFAQSAVALERKGFITQRDRERLELVVEAGNAAVHRGQDFGQQHAEVLVHIVENLLRSVYFPQKAMDSVKSAIPPREQARRR